MGHGKLIKFAENETFRCLVQPDPARLLALKTDPHGPLVLADHPLKGNWNAEMFAKPQPLVVELGCGKGEYTIDLSRRNPDFNYIGVDIKGARLWKGAKEAETAALPNVAFLRTRVEFLPALFAPGEAVENRSVPGRVAEKLGWCKAEYPALNAGKVPQAIWYIISLKPLRDLIFKK